MQAASAWLAYSEGKKKEAIDILTPARMLKISWVSIPSRRERSFRFGNNSVFCCWKSGQPKEAQSNLRPRSKFIPDDSADCMERRKPPRKPATLRMQAATTQNWPHKRRKLAVHEMN